MSNLKGNEGFVMVIPQGDGISLCDLPVFIQRVAELSAVVVAFHAINSEDGPRLAIHCEFIPGMTEAERDAALLLAEREITASATH